MKVQYDVSNQHLFFTGMFGEKNQLLTVVCEESGMTCIYEHGDPAEDCDFHFIIDNHVVIEPKGDIV